MSCKVGIQKKLNKINEQSIQHSKIAQFIKQNIVQLNVSSNIHTLILFYKQHMIKNTSWTFFDFIQPLLIFVA